MALETDLDSDIDPAEKGSMASPKAARNGHVDEAIRERLNSLYERAKAMNMCKTNSGFVDHIRKLLQLPGFDINTITAAQLDIVEQDIAMREQQAARAA